MGTPSALLDDGKGNELLLASPRLQSRIGTGTPRPASRRASSTMIGARRCVPEAEGGFRFVLPSPLVVVESCRKEKVMNVSEPSRRCQLRFARPWVATSWKACVGGMEMRIPAGEKKEESCGVLGQDLGDMCSFCTVRAVLLLPFLVSAYH